MSRSAPEPSSGADQLARTRLIATDEASAYLGVPPATLRQWVSQEKGPRSYKIGRHRKYRVADLDAFVEAGASRPAGSAA